MLIYLSGGLAVLARPRDGLGGFKDTLFLRFSEDECHDCLY
jgi:hypothetical protein